VISLLWKLKKLSCFSLFIAALNGCGSYLPPLPLVKPITEDDEKRISREFRREAKQHLKLVSHPEIERYVNRVGQNILSAMGRQTFDYRFFVIQNSQLNAFAVPGGSIYVHTGLLERLSRTDELAGVLGHEIVHVKGRHIARISGPDPITLLSLASVFLAGSSPQGQAAGAVGQAIAATRQLSYTRQLEQEADTLGVRYMVAAGYDPKGILDFLKIVNQERAFSPGEIPTYLRTHPLTQDRMTHVGLVIRSLNVDQARAKAADPIKRIQTILRLEKYQADDIVSEQERLLSQNPESGEPLHLIGIVRHFQRRWEEAEEYYERARELSPESPGIDRDLGRIYTQIGKFRLAHEALERSLSVDPKEPLNYILLGKLFEKEANFREAVSAYLRAQNLSPLWAEPSQRLGVVYGKLDRLGDAYHYLGRSHLLSDEDEEAIADFQRAIKIFGPDSPRGRIIKEELDIVRARS
jgi:predicted Zn-dependent protease